MKVETHVLTLSSKARVNFSFFKQYCDIIYVLSMDFKHKYLLTTSNANSFLVIKLCQRRNGPTDGVH